MTGPHLHWICAYGAISVDPMSLVRLGREPREVSFDEADLNL